MTNWFEKLNITKNDLKNFFEKNIKNDYWTIEQSENNYCVSRDIGQPGECGFSTEYYSLSPFYLKKMFKGYGELKPIDSYMKLASDKDAWNFKGRLTLADFTSTPKEYYQFMLSKCNENDKKEYLKELKELYTKTIKTEISLLKEKASEIKKEFDKEIIARQKMLLDASKNMFDNKSTPSNKRSEEDIENE